MKLEKLEKDTYYHVYNRGINGGVIFKNQENKRYFLELAKKYLSEKVVILAYCLMDNHYHMAIRTLADEKSITQAFSNLFNAYAKAFNKREGRTGSLFEKHFKRIPINDEDYLRNLIVYIHLNPQNHGVSKDFSTFGFSSYHLFKSNNQEEVLKVNKKETLALFEDMKNMEYVHYKKLGKSIELSDLQSTLDENELRDVADENELQGVVDKGDPRGVVDEVDLQGVVDEVDLQGVVDEGDLLVGLNSTRERQPGKQVATNKEGQGESDLQGVENLAGLAKGKASNMNQISESEENKNTPRGVVDEGDLPVGLNKSVTRDKFYKYIQELQETITKRLEDVDGKAKFQEDLWKRPEGGGGRTRVIENGAVLEKGGVNISAVHGALPESMQNYFGVKDADFFACGLSLVLHPKSPMVPTVHANWRYFEMYDKTGQIVDQWFGGGQDLTPYYLFDEDASHFHSVCKKACDAHHPEFHAKFKKKCDDYFWNTHRNEARGVGGLFFDYCKADESMNMNDWYNFVTEVGNSFLEAYVPIVIKRKDLEYSQSQKDWQEIRRGRYVEFNLVHDKGTLFGLRTNGRIESILMSLPPQVQWRYDHHPEPDSEEERLLKVLAQPKNWIA